MRKNSDAGQSEVLDDLVLESIHSSRANSMGGSKHSNFAGGNQGNMNVTPNSYAAIHANELPSARSSKSNRSLTNAGRNIIGGNVGGGSSGSNAHPSNGENITQHSQFSTHSGKAAKGSGKKGSKNSNVFEPHGGGGGAVTAAIQGQVSCEYNRDVSNSNSVGGKKGKGKKGKKGSNYGKSAVNPNMTPVVEKVKVNVPVFIGGAEADEDSVNDSHAHRSEVSSRADKVFQPPNAYNPNSNGRNNANSNNKFIEGSHQSAARPQVFEAGSNPNIDFESELFDPYANGGKRTRANDKHFNGNIIFSLIIDNRLIIDNK